MIIQTPFSPNPSFPGEGGEIYGFPGEWSQISGKVIPNMTLAASLKFP